MSDEIPDSLIFERSANHESVSHWSNGDLSWGPLIVRPFAMFKRRMKDKKSDRVIRLITPFPSQQLEIYVSPTGRSVRVYRNHKELT